MSRPSVALFDYGFGNVHSAHKALEAAGAEVELTRDAARVMAADGMVVPGVGSMAACLEGLRAARGDQLLERRLAGGRPVLGICVGMQILFEHGVEGGADVEGLGQWPGTVQRLDATVLPHMGWNTIDAPEDSTLFEGVHDERFYFVHSFGVPDWTLDVDERRRVPRVTWASHDRPFVAAVENGPLSATQFHPEKSGDAGLRVLANWVRSLTE